MKRNITIGDKILPIVIRKHSRSRRMVIRYRSVSNSLTLTLPRYASLRQGLSFIEEKRAWIVQQMNKKPARVEFYPGAEIPVFGNKCNVCHVGGRGVVYVENGIIFIPGQAEFMSRKLKDWLKKAARDEISRLAHIHAEKIGRKIRKIGLRDTVSHWGSCNRIGNLSFSWRLVFAPRHVLEYVVCHEVAHLAHLNHSREFWKLVAELCPGFEEARHWLHQNGDKLYSYG